MIGKRTRNAFLESSSTRQTNILSEINFKKSNIILIKKDFVYIIFYFFYFFEKAYFFNHSFENIFFFKDTFFLSK